MDLPPLPPILAWVPEPRRISGFWRRLFAYFLDGILLAIPALVAGFSFYAPLAALGGWGRLIGLVVAVLYFGYFNSERAGGQSPGQRVMGIEVVDASGGHISFGRSLVRFAVLAVPLTLSDIPFPARIMGSPLGVLFIFISISFIGAIAYLYVCNRRTRQSLHDLVAGTYVVDRIPAGPFNPPRIWSGHLIVAGVWCGLIAASLFVLPQLFHTPLFVSMASVQREIEALPDVSQASIRVNTNWSWVNGVTTTTRSVNSQARWKRRPVSYQAAASDVAAVILRTYPAADRTDFIVINVIYGFDLGIAQWHTSISYSKTPAQWRALIAQAI